MLLGTPAVVRGVNVIGRRPTAQPPNRPKVWLAAHYDSKGQPISMATRTLGALALALGALATPAAIVPALLLLFVGIAILARNRVTDRSTGALDNVTGLVAILAILDTLPRGADVGVLFLDAEEYGLVGARALVAERPDLLQDGAVINFDSLDDRGGCITVLHRPGPLGQAVAAELGGIRGRWVPVVVDGIALARGPVRECVTIMKGDWGSARVVHTPRDTADRLTLDAVRQVAAGVARVLPAR